MLYKANPTMQLLGYQYYQKIFTDERENAFDDMLNAHRNEGHMHYIDIAMDAFMLGYIYGKRAERVRRK